MLAILSLLSLFIGVADLDLTILLDGDADQWRTLLASRVPRLLAILCTGAGNACCRTDHAATGNRMRDQIEFLIVNLPA